MPILLFNRERERERERERKRERKRERSRDKISRQQANRPCVTLSPNIWEKKQREDADGGRGDSEGEGFNSPRELTPSFTSVRRILRAHPREYRREQDATRLSVQERVSRNRGGPRARRDPEASPERMFRVLRAARMPALAGTGTSLPKYETAAASTESSRRNYATSPSLPLSLSLSLSLSLYLSLCTIWFARSLAFLSLPS